MLSLRLLTCLLAFLYALQLNSQTLRLLNSETGAPIENMAIFTADHRLRTLSDNHGEASIDRFAPDDTLVFQHVSYRTQQHRKDSLEAAGFTLYFQTASRSLDELIISASRNPERISDVPGMTDRLPGKLIEQSQVTNSSDLLSLSGNVLVQKSQGGGGSPVLRGFEANRVLLVVDGVRMNNAIYRSGHLQNSLTLDAGFLERVEILYGPASVMYGSDALGGVVHYFTREPEFRMEGEKPFNLHAGITWASANQGTTSHLDFSLAGIKLASATSITVSDFGDLAAGRQRSPWLGDYGKTMFYVGQVQGRDSAFANHESWVQKGSGYKQYDLVQKIKMKVGSRSELFLNLQYSTSSDINRFDYLNDMKGDQPKYAEWYYGPQTRMMAALGARVNHPNQFFTSFVPLFSFQQISEDRITRNFRSTDRYYQLEDVKVWSLTLDFNKLLLQGGSLAYGLIAELNRVGSEGSREDILTGERYIDYSRYPDEGSTFSTTAAYWNFTSTPGQQLGFRAGARYSRSFLNVRFSEFYSMLPYREVNTNRGALTGSMGLLYKPTPGWALDLVASTGFRTPNVDDLGKVRAKNGEVTVPNPDLKPEYSWNLELGIKKEEAGVAGLEVNFFTSFLQNAIVPDRFRLNGMDSLEYQGDWYQLVSNTNTSQALIYGVSVQLRSHPGKPLQFRSTLNYTFGEDLSSGEPLGHIPPVYGRMSVGWTREAFEAECWLAYSGWKRLEDMDQSAGSEDNLAEATEYGFPSWYTLNARLSYSPNDKLRLSLGMENLLNSFYKTFASGIAAPGRNIIVSARVSL
ncbi:MAG: TonB-dependent receptor [Bacteroidales bacterium]